MYKRQHLSCVWTYAKTIGELEGLDADTQFILEVAAITHDIACLICDLQHAGVAMLDRLDAGGHVSDAADGQQDVYKRQVRSFWSG